VLVSASLGRMLDLEGRSSTSSNVNPTGMLSPGIGISLRLNIIRNFNIFAFANAIPLPKTLDFGRSLCKISVIS